MKKTVCSLFLIAASLLCAFPLQAASSTLGQIGDAVSGAVEDAGSAVGSAVDKAGAAASRAAGKTGAYLDDSAITAEIKAVLLREKGIDSGDISVATTGGHVTLNGKVETKEQKYKALGLVHSVEGVKSVSSNLIVTGDGKPKENSFFDDVAITAAVKKALFEEKGINSTDISVTTRNGMVYLGGSVRNAEELGKVLNLVWSVEGVRSVESDLIISGKTSQTAGDYASDAAVTARVKTALGSANASFVMNVSVETENGVTRLTGEVDNESSKRQAGIITQNVDGVRQVVNDLAVKK